MELGSSLESRSVGPPSPLCAGGGRPLWVSAPSNARRQVPLSPIRIAPDRRAKAATPSPVPSSGLLAPLDGLSCARGPHVLLRSTPFTVAPRRFAALFHAARVPGAALQSFPFPGSRARSRRPLLPCGFALDPFAARRGEAFHDRFHRAGSSPCRAPVPKDVSRRREAPPDPCDRCPDPFGPRREANHPERGVAISRNTRHSEPSAVSSPSRARRERPARPLRSLAPPGSPFARPRDPCRGHEAGSVLSWAFLSPELAPVTIQVRCLAVELGDPRFRGDGRWLAPLSRGLRLFPSRQRLAPPSLGSSCRKRGHPACSAEPFLRPRGLEPESRRRARSIEPSVPPPGSGRNRLAFMNARRIRRQPRR